MLGTIFTMAEDLIKVVGTKEEIYQGLLPQIKALVGEETDTIANLANTCAALKEAFDFFWVGFYLVKNDVENLGNLVKPFVWKMSKNSKDTLPVALYPKVKLLFRFFNKE